MNGAALVIEEFSEAEALRILAQWSHSLRANQEAEVYEASAGDALIELRRSAEPPFGPPLFKAHLRSSRRTELPGLFLSPGRFGQLASQFAGDPFSPDSKNLALISVESAKVPSFHGCIFAVSSGKKRFKSDMLGPMLHHSWSPDSRFWLAQIYGEWVLWDSHSNKISRRPGGNRFFPKHAAFLAPDLLLAVSEDRGTASLLSLPGWGEVASLEIEEFQAPAFSFPVDDGLAMGMEVRFGSTVGALRWIVIRR